MYYHRNVAPLVELASDGDDGHIHYLLYDSIKSLRAERYGELAPYLAATWPLVPRRNVLLYLMDTAMSLGEVSYGRSR